MGVVQTSKRRLVTVTLVNKYKALKKIGGGQTYIATAKKNGLTKNTVSLC